jgi:hypothetical protein
MPRVRNRTTSFESNADKCEQIGRGQLADLVSEAEMFTAEVPREDSRSMRGSTSP